MNTCWSQKVRDSRGTIRGSLGIPRGSPWIPRGSLTFLVQNVFIFPGPDSQKCFPMDGTSGVPDCFGPKCVQFSRSRFSKMFSYGLYPGSPWDPGIRALGPRAWAQGPGPGPGPKGPGPKRPGPGPKRPGPKGPGPKIDLVPFSFHVKSILSHSASM